jgi:hypothetical protein
MNDRLVGASAGFLALGGATNFIHALFWVFGDRSAGLDYVFMTVIASGAFLFAAWTLITSGLKYAYIAMVLLAIFGCRDVLRLFASHESYQAGQQYGIPYLVASAIVHSALFVLLLWLFFRQKSNAANQALVPTPASVTPAANAPVAPDAGAAHL